ncbi:MAG: thioredoxin family protein [Anaerolineales bacterium]
MLERAALAFGLILLGSLAFFAYQRFQLRRRRGQQMGIPGYKPGVASILYFTTPTCAPCRTIQRPALKQVIARFNGSLQVLEFDATKQPQLADSWGVLSVPTTFIIDPEGRPRGVNHGVARAGKLQRQLNEIGLKPRMAQPVKQPQIARESEV